MRSPTTPTAWISGLVLLALLAGCSTPATRSSSLPPAALTGQDAGRLLADAAVADRPTAARLRTEAAGILLQQGQPRRAREVLEGIAAGDLAGSTLARHALVLARLLLQEGDPHAARDALLGNAALNETLPLLPADEQVQLGQVRADVLALLGDPLASARERIFIAPLIRQRQPAVANHDAIWQALMATPWQALEQAALNPADTDLQGWLTLALIGKQHQGDLDTQVADLLQWQREHPDHPASLTPPGGLDMLRLLSEQRPRQVAVLLPASGRLAASGQAIRDGLMAAWYDARRSGARVPTIRFHDTGEADFITLYRQAVADGAQLVIGPLDKPQLRALFDAGPLPVPTLALNEVSDYGQPPANLYQLSLGAEQETAQLVRRMQGSAHHGILILHEPDVWASRAADTLQGQWLASGGHVVARTSWDNARRMPDALKAALGITRSELRQRDLEVAAGLPLRTEPHRRRDIDAIALLASPDGARLLMPMLQFLYAGSIPVYATSQVFSGTPNPDADHDLDRIRFCDMGWLMQPGHPLRQQLAPWSGTTTPYLRLYALGADAFLVHPRLAQLEQFPSSVFAGYSGQLSLNAHRQFTRELDCAVFRNGLPLLLPAVAAGPAWD